MCCHSEGKTHFEEVFAENIHSIKAFPVVFDFYKLYAMFSEILQLPPSLQENQRIF